MELGRISKIELRDVWKNEPENFTQWLASPENIVLLGEELGLDIAVLEVEASVGDFHADILAQEETSGKKIIIENQLEPSDHRHFGQILTYAAGLQAEYIIWIVKTAREEHQQAIDWLNSHTDDAINLFLVSIELWQIGHSEPAPKFVVLSRPNDWARAVRSHVNDSGTLTETKIRQLDFWEQLKMFAAQHRPPLRLPTPRAQHWYNVAVGRSDCHLSLTLHIMDNKIGCELYIPNNKALYHVIYAKKDEIQEALAMAGTLVWQELPEKKASRIRVMHPYDFTNEDRSAAFQWLVETSIRFRNTFPNFWQNVGA